jgi:hypothetical protein
MIIQDKYSPISMYFYQIRNNQLIDVQQVRRTCLLSILSYSDYSSI